MRACANWNLWVCSEKWQSEVDRCVFNEWARERYLHVACASERESERKAFCVSTQPWGHAKSTSCMEIKFNFWSHKSTALQTFVFAETQKVWRWRLTLRRTALSLFLFILLVPVCHCVFGLGRELPTFAVAAPLPCIHIVHGTKNREHWFSSESNSCAPAWTEIFTTCVRETKRAANSTQHIQVAKTKCIACWMTHNSKKVNIIIFQFDNE